ncbi:MAG: efflux transporter outer membrane subunit [Lentisphaerae bacterium]|nr:efflux transporter outer membrane subunit [Lentisphaerota bacterium]
MRGLARWLPAGLVCAIAAASCTSLRPDLESAKREAGALPAAYAAAETGGGAVSNAWWRSFGSPELDGLMARALRGNMGVAAAEARLRQARAVAEKAGAALRPEVTGSAGAGVTRVRGTGQGGARATTTVEDYSLGLAASYEIDLWGRVRAVRSGAGLAAEASASDLETARMTVAAQVADRWLALREANAQVDLIRAQIGTNERVLDLLRERLVRTSATVLLDVYQQEQSLRATEALLPPAVQRADLLRNELAVLVGEPAGADIGGAGRDLPSLPPAPAAGVPADLLARRPDLCAQRARLEAAGWDVAAARADRLPALRLTGAAAYDSAEFADLLDDWVLNLAAGLAAPVFDAGRRRAEVDRVRAALDVQLAQYRQVVLDAAREVEDALVRERRLGERLDAKRRELASATRALDEARRSYLKGGSGYLPVLLAMRSVQALEREEVAAGRELLANRVSLYRALGGDWSGAAVDRAVEMTEGKAP